MKTALSGVARGHPRWRTSAAPAGPDPLPVRQRRRAIRFVFADGGFAEKLVDWARRVLATTVHSVRKPEGQQGFAVIARRWVVERTLAWLTAHRRQARDYERDPAVSEAMIRWAAINQMVRRITRGRPATRQRRWQLAHTPE